MDVLLTGGDTELGRAIAEGFRDAGHKVVIAGARRDDLEVAAKELDVDYIVFDNTDAASLDGARSGFPHHIDTIINVPAPAWGGADPRTFTLAERATAWRSALDATMLSAVLTVQILGDHLRSGGSIVNVVADSPEEGTPEAAIKAAVPTGPRARPPTSASAASPSTPSHPVRAPSPAMTASAAPRRRSLPRSPVSHCSSPLRRPGTSPARHCT